jgi:hypothetical protein
MGGLSRQLNESVEKRVTGQVNNHKMAEPNSMSLYSTPQSQPQTRAFESVGFKLRDKMNRDKQSR